MVKLKKQTNSYVIYDAHEDLPRQILNKYYIPAFLRKIFSKVAEIIENYFSKKLDFVIAATPYIKERFINIGCKSVDINNFPILEEFMNINHNWDNKEKTVCYIGAISKVRGIYQIIEACKM